MGMRAKVIKSKDRFQKGISGIVVDDTRNTLLLHTTHGEKRIIKKTSTFKFIANKNTFTIPGTLLECQPYERTGKLMRYYKNFKV
ncbi:MAG: ribonuclease P protein subunit [Candidatus Micrarchaeaceae archaeon]